MALTFFKTPKNKQYKYKPVYYNPRKEAVEKLSKSAYSGSKEGQDDYEKALRDRMQLRWKRSSGAKARKASRGRLLVVLVALFILVYLIFYI